MGRARSSVALIAAALGLLAGHAPSAATAAQKHPDAVAQQARRKRRKQFNRKATSNRKGRIANLLRLERLNGGLWAHEEAELRDLVRRERLARGRLARKMARRRFTIVERLRMQRGKRRPIDRPAYRADGRVPRSVRIDILRRDGRRVSGRQWKKLRKALRAEDRANRSARRQGRAA